MDKKQIILRDPAELAIHPLAKLAPEWSNDDPRFISLVEDIRDRGLDYPLLVDSEGNIADGRLRWRAVKRLGMRQVPTCVVWENEIASVILCSLVHRRHFTKGALAYSAFPFYEPALKESNKRRLENLRNPNVSSKATQLLSAKNTEQFAEALGFNRTFFYQARDIHAAFFKTPALKAEFEPRILAGEIGLGACLAGIAGKLATDGKARRATEQLELFEDAFDILKMRFSYWQKFDTAQKAQMGIVLRKTVAEMPADLRDEFAKALKATNKEAKL